MKAEQLTILWFCDKKALCKKYLTLCQIKCKMYFSLTLIEETKMLKPLHFGKMEATLTGGGNGWVALYGRGGIKIPMEDFDKANIDPRQDVKVSFDLDEDGNISSLVKV